MRIRAPRTRFLVATALAVVLSAGAAAADDGSDWPWFRGPDRSGISSESGLADSWSEEGPRELWRVPLGEGYSAISVVGNRLFTMYAGEEGGKAVEFAAAFDAATGKELWRTVIGEKYDTEFGNGPRATPTVDDGRVFVLGSKGDLAALSAEDGSELWRMNVLEAFGAALPNWGYSTSAVVDGDRLILETGGAEGKTFAGIEVASGEVAWTAGEGRAGYNSGLPVSIGGTSQFVHVSGGKLRSIDRDGNELWSMEWPRGETHAMPVFIPPDRIYASGAEGVGAKMVRVGGGDGGLSVETLWENRLLRNHFSSAVYADGMLYGFDNATFKAASAEDGEMAWAKRGLGKGSLILADGKLIVLSDRGELLLLEANSESYVERGRVQALEGLCWTAPVLARGRLYLRNHEEMVAYDLSR